MRWIACGAVTLAACLPTYSYDRAPLPEPTQSEQAACYRAKRFQLLRGDANWRTQHQSGNYIITEYWHSHGIAFRRGDERLDADAAIALLPDPELAKGYQDVLAETEGASARYPFMRNVSFLMAGVGLGLAFAALGVVLVDVDSPLVWPLVIGGSAVALGSAVPAIIASRSYEDAVRHDLDRHLYRRSEWAGRMVGAVESYNQRVAQECGHAPADVPMTPGARALVETSVRAPQAPPVAPPAPPPPFP